MRIVVTNTGEWRGVVVDPVTGLWACAWLSPRRDGLFAKTDLEVSAGARLLVRAPCPDGAEVLLSCTAVDVVRDGRGVCTGMSLRLPAHSEREIARLGRGSRLPLAG